jgi:hypothetical protein
MTASCCSRATWIFTLLYAPVAMLTPCVRAHALVGDGLVVRGGDLSCEAETGSSTGKLVGGAANWLKTGRLAS